MEIVIKGPLPKYEIEHLARLFFPPARLQSGESRGKDRVYVRAARRRLAVGLCHGGRCVYTVCALPANADAEQEACRALYHLLKAETDLCPPWGMLTGVRPVNRLRKLTAARGAAEAKRSFLEESDVSPAKYRLARHIADCQAPVLASSAKNSYSLYISVPFCPSRCAYCSFVSRSIERETKLIQPYLLALQQELAATSATAKSLGLRLESIYIGGGTPTALPVAELEQLLCMVARYFDTAAVREYTVEAGRPDCTGYDKLALLKAFGVGRISINPQTMQDAVLQAIGRRHTAGDILRCMEDARRAGHTIINMDLIAGLPGDTPAGFRKTLEAILPLSPENITLHTLTLKRASNLVIDQTPAASSVPDEMLRAGYSRFAQEGYHPYYLYRQKNTVSNLENTGWAKPGYECLYNIFIMEEAHSILAAGAGGTTKLVRQAGGQIRRIANYKYPADYIEGLDTILGKKAEVEAFYGSPVDTQAADGSRVD